VPAPPKHLANKGSRRIVVAIKIEIEAIGEGDSERVGASGSLAVMWWQNTDRA
jgi:hypothetical protein